MNFTLYIMQAPVSLALLIITLFISLYSFFINNSWFELFILHPFSVKEKRNYYTFITSAFLHGDLVHLVVNAVFIFYFCFTLEQYIGSVFILVLYFVSVIASNIAVYLKYKNNTRIYNLGASGALVAVLVSLMIINPNHQVKLFFIPATVPGVLFIGAYISYLYYIVQSKTDNVNHEPHLVGAITGLVFTIIFHPQVLKKFILQF